ncbi:MAG TPA: hypothetical protein VD971_13505 [Phycisphaerales bacterium]|nr:hypothetical protein [Phycisphaerales bacterium]
MHSAIRSVSLLALTATGAHAQVSFSDNFDNGPSPQWMNQRGNWAAVNGRYDALAPSNSPPTLTTLPYVLGDFELALDVHGAVDGGVWLHTDGSGDNGVLLVIGGFSHTGNGFYFHRITNGSYGGPEGLSGPQFAPGSDIHVRVTAVGATYSVYLNGNTTPATTLTLPQPRTGLVGLYDYATPGHSYDNVVLTDTMCDSIDFNGDGLFPDNQDIEDFFSVFGGGPCSTGACGDIDFNNDGLFPDNLDLELFLSVFGGGGC